LHCLELQSAACAGEEQLKRHGQSGAHQERVHIPCLVLRRGSGSGKSVCGEIGDETRAIYEYQVENTIPSKGNKCNVSVRVDAPDDQYRYFRK
jgi:hypothetical protein